MRRTLMRWKDFKVKAVTLSYDDGVVFDKRLIEIMDANGLKGTFNLNSGLYAQDENARRLTADSATALYKNTPHEVAVHGFKHLSLAEVDEGMMSYEIATDRQNLETQFGKIIKGMAYANGSFDDKVVEVLKRCGISYARTTQATHAFDVPEEWLKMPATCHHADPRLMELAEQFIESKPRSYVWANRPMLFYLWGHSYEFNDSNNWEIIQEFAEYVGNRDDIWYATNGEIYDYVQAFDRLQFSADGTKVYNPSVIGVYISYLGKDSYIPAGATVNI